MRHAIVLSAVLVASPIFGQDDPLPAVTPRTQQPPAVYVALAVEPIREEPAFSLEDAARANDYATFNALFEQTGNPAYAPLHELWTYSVNDPIGAFYGAEMYERFASLYPEFAAYIEDYRIVDDRGNVFYPTSETRAFLLARAIEGRTVAPQEPIRVAATKRRSGSERTSGSERRSGFSLTPASASEATPPPPRRVRFKKAELTPPPAPVGLKPNLRSAPVPVKRAPAPVVTAAMVPEKPDLAARGILLILIGLMGVGFLAMLLRAPGEPPADDASAASDLGKAPQ